MWDAQGRLLLHHRHVGGGWAPLSGTVEPAANLLEALHRELNEETRLVVAVRRLVAVYSDPAFQIVRIPDGSRVHFVTCLFDCKVTAGTLRGSWAEAGRWEWFEPSELPEGLLPYARVWLDDAPTLHDHVVVR